MKKQAVNYLLHHQEVSRRLAKDEVSPIVISVYSALFLIWNESRWDDVLSINRQDVMKMAKVGNKNTYTAALHTLHEKGYIDYKPSHNPLIGSLVTLTTFGTSTNSDTSIKSGKGGGTSSGKGGGTLYKLSKQLETLQTDNTILSERLSSAIAEGELLKVELSKRDTLILTLSNELAEERKKGSAQKKKEAEKTPYWKMLVKEWHRFYSANHGGNEPLFNAASGAALKSIMQELQKRFFGSNAIPIAGWTQEIAVTSLNEFLSKAWQDQWLKTHFSLSTLLSKFNEIAYGNEHKSNSKARQQSETGGNVDLNSAFSKVDALYRNTVPD